ncbi:MAG TPA: glycosyltransferase family 39 protein [Candidatus Peribacteraceae bacterium]|nr:glycosyltransferase family 39 protein [Candidatus Peribacteraceae bacterium]
MNNALHAHRIAAKTIVFLVLFCCLLVVRFILTPRWTSAMYETPDGTMHPLALSGPLLVENQKSVVLELTLRRTSLSPTTYYIESQNCLESLIIDGIPAEEHLLPACYAEPTSAEFNGKQISIVSIRGLEIDLDSAERTGEHTVRFHLTNTRAPVGIRLYPIPSNLLWLHLLFLVLVLWYGSALLKILGPRLGIRAPLQYALLGGVALRMLYFSYTPFFERAYDMNGHIEYIMHILNYWMIPAAGTGWETHQQPLYYLLSAIWMHATGLIGRPFVSQLNDIRFFSLLSAIGVFLLGIWIGKLLLREKQNQKVLLLFTGLLATLPGLIFLSSRINNDALAYLLSFLAFGLLLRWWQRGSERDWYILCVVLGVALLTKLTPIALLAVAVLCLLTTRHHTFPRKIHMGVILLLILGTLLGGTISLRMRERPATIMSSPMNSGLVVENSLANFLAFSPQRLIARPFNNNWDDRSGRQFFWESFLKTVFFGEWNFGRQIGFLGSCILLIVCFLILYLFAGGWMSFHMQRSETLPLWLTVCGLLASLLYFRYTHPYSSNQDFRYIPLVAVPAAYCIAYGIEHAPPSLRFVGQFLAYGLMGLCAIFIVLLGVHA